MGPFVDQLDHRGEFLQLGLETRRRSGDLLELVSDKSQLMAVEDRVVAFIDVPEEGEPLPPRHSENGPEVEVAKNEHGAAVVAHERCRSHGHKCANAAQFMADHRSRCPPG